MAAVSLLIASASNSAHEARLFTATFGGYVPSISLGVCHVFVRRTSHPTQSRLIFYIRHGTKGKLQLILFLRGGSGGDPAGGGGGLDGGASDAGLHTPVGMPSGS